MRPEVFGEPPIPEVLRIRIDLSRSLNPPVLVLGPEFSIGITYAKEWARSPWPPRILTRLLRSATDWREPLALVG